MTIRQHLRRWWDNRVSDWMEFEDRRPRVAAGISVGLLIGYGVLLMLSIIWISLR